MLAQCNGIIVRCPGFFEGEAIVAVNSSHKVITVALMATNPELQLFTSAFYNLCDRSFSQCISTINLLLHIILSIQIDIITDIGATEYFLCPKCIVACFLHSMNALPLDKIGNIKNKPGLVQVSIQLILYGYLY